MKRETLRAKKRGKSRLQRDKADAADIFSICIDIFFLGLPGFFREFNLAGLVLSGGVYCISVLHTLSRRFLLFLCVSGRLLICSIEW